MPADRRQRRGGQAVVLVAIAALLLAGILMLALDGGGIYLERRQLQNAADAAALAGAEGLSASPPNYTTVHTNAMNLLVRNLPGTSIPGGFSPGAAQTRVPTAGFLGIGANYQVVLQVLDAFDYQVTVTHLHSVAVAPIHGFAGTINLQAQATAENADIPYAIAVLQDVQPGYGALALNGTSSQLTLKGGGGPSDAGGAFSNASIHPMVSTTVTFNPCGNAGDLWAYSEDPAQAPDVAARVTGGQATNTTTSCVAPPPTYPLVASMKLIDPGYPEPLPPARSYNVPISVSSGTMYLCPGTYNATISNTGGTMILMPGVYRINSTINVSGTGHLRTATAGPPSDFPPPGGATTNCALWPTAPADGDYGVILEFVPFSCAAIQFNEVGQTMTLTASPKYNNITIYVEPYPNWRTVCSTSPLGTHVVKIAATGKYTIKGAIYAPADNVSLSVNAAGSGVGQVIAWTLTIGGTGNVDVSYDPTGLPYIKGLVQ